jgi:predicted phosphodiesterase
MKITLMSDSHSKHRVIEKEDLPGGDILIHSGDL